MFNRLTSERSDTPFFCCAWAKFLKSRCAIYGSPQQLSFYVQLTNFGIIVLRIQVLVFTVLAFGAAALGSPSFAAESGAAVPTAMASVVITVDFQNRIAYDVTPGPQTDHLHVYVDGKLVGQTRQLKGNFKLEDFGLPAGKHTICFRVSNRAHIELGPEGCTDVEAK